MASRRLLSILLCCIVYPLVVLGQATSHVPQNLNEAHEQLLTLFSGEQIQQIKAMKSETEMVRYHMGIGTALRNDWGLWKGSALSRYFNDLGIRHPDDMSGIILETFWCKLHDQPFKLEQRVANYQDFWRSQADPVGDSPRDGAKIDWYIIKGSGKGTIHLGISISDHSYWRSEYGSSHGIEPATADDSKELDNMQQNWKQLGVKHDEGTHPQQP